MLPFCSNNKLKLDYSKSKEKRFSCFRLMCGLRTQEWRWNTKRRR